MPSTHTNLHFHTIFSTKNRFPFLHEEWRARLHEYLGGCVRGLGGTPLRVDGVEDHVHLLFGLKPICALADVIREMKKASTSWVRESFDRKFQWQEGYGAFSVSRGEMARVDRYIRGQQEHHRSRTFEEEYVAFLTEEGIEYDPRFLW
jgi:REP element-mobilizing transposase RayT